MKERKTKKIMGLIVCLLLSSSILGACGANKTNSASKKDKTVKVAKKGYPIIEEKIQMTMMAPGVSGAEWGEMPNLLEYAKKSNIEFEYQTPPSADFATRLNLAFASGELPDVIFAASSNNLNRSMEADYGNQGMLIPLEDLIEDYAPHLNKYLNEYPDFKKSITTPDGHIYSLPRIHIPGKSDPTYISSLWYNGEWLENLGIKSTDIPTNTDELFDLLMRFKNEDPNKNGKKDEIPLSDAKLVMARTWLMPAFGIKINGIEEVNGKVRFAPMTEGYKGYLEYMNKLYTNGLLNKEIFTISDEQQSSLVEADKIGLYGDFKTPSSSEKPTEYYPMFQQLTSEYAEKPLAPGHPRLSTGLFAITNKCEYPEAAMRWVDYFYTDEGAIFLTQGLEGDLWKLEKNDEGKEVRVKNSKISPEEEGKYIPSYGLQVPGIANEKLPGLKDSANDPDIPLATQYYREERDQKILPYAEIPYPIVYMTEQENDKLSENATDITLYVEQMEAKFITGIESLDNWDNYVKTLKSMGVDNYIKVHQQAYNRWAKQ